MHKMSFELWSTLNDTVKSYKIYLLLHEIKYTNSEIHNIQARQYKRLCPTCKGTSHVAGYSDGNVSAEDCPNPECDDGGIFIEQDRNTAQPCEHSSYRGYQSNLSFCSYCGVKIEVVNSEKKI